MAGEGRDSIGVPWHKSPPLGLLLMDGNRWRAVREWDGLCRDGEGDVSGLPSGIWLTNLSAIRAARLARDRQDLLLHGMNWLRIPWGQLLAEWGIAPGDQLDNAPFLAAVTGRIVRIATGVRDMIATGKTSRARARQRFLRSGSLAAGLHGHLAGPMSRKAPAILSFSNAPGISGYEG